MDAHMPDCLVTGDEPLIETLTLPDPDDRHVLAAAIHCDAKIIVTKNLKDFPAPILSVHRIAAKHPDDFLFELLGAQEGPVCEAVRAVHARLKNPPKSWDDYFSTLEAQELIQTVTRLRELIDLG